MTTATDGTPITAQMVSALRETTGAPLMKCKAALQTVGGDMAQAETLLREQGVKTSPTQKEGNQGYIAVYMHPGNQVVGLVELACTTDFVARSTEFRAVADELAMQVAASAPSVISMDYLPSEVREAEIALVQRQVETDRKMANKSEALRAEIVAKKVANALEERCLLTQMYIRDPNQSVGALIDDLKLRVREGIYVRRIARWRVGEPL